MSSVRANGRSLKVLFVGLAVAVVVLAGGAAALVAGVTAAGDPPDNDEFVGAVPVADAHFAGSTADATVSADEEAIGAGSAGERAVWFSWEAPAGGWTFVTPTLADGTVPDVQVYRGEELATLERVDVAADPGTGDAGVSVPADGGTTYAIAVVSPDEIEFDLTLFQPDFGTRPNDEPAGSIDAGAAALASVDGSEREVAVDTLEGATVAPSEPGAAGSAPTRSVWYSWEPAGAGQATFAAAGEFGDAGPFTVGVWTGEAIADLAPVAGGSGGATLTAVVGERYLISVDGPAEWYRLTVSTSGVPGEDVDAPTVVCDPAPAGWLTEITFVAGCTASDGGSGLADPADAAFELVAEAPDGVETDAATTDSRTVCDTAGNCTDAGPVGPLQLDRRAPSVTCAPAPDAWSADDVGLTCLAEDLGSGLANDDDAERLITAGVADGEEAQVVPPALTVCDVAGNCTAAPPFGPLLVDRKPPTVTCAAPPTGAQRDEVVVECTASDGGSGLADAEGDAAFSLTTEVGEGRADLDASTDGRDVCDGVGNCAAAGPITGLSIDRAVPGVRCAVPDGWQRGVVEVACEVTDEGVGLTAGVPASVTLTATLPDGEVSDAVSTSSVADLCDGAGNCAEAGPLTVKIDNAAPVVTCADAPATWSREAEVTVDCGVDDGDGSGLADDEPTIVRLAATAANGVEGEFATDADEACDLAGNCAAVGPVTGVRIDRREPQVDCDPPPAGTRRTEVAIACSATDGGAGVVGESTFELTTAVGAGNADPSAETGSREVCDVADNCVDAGPFTVTVDLTAPAAGAGPDVDVPGRVTVLAAVDPFVPVPAPYALPDAGGAAVTCAPAPGVVAGEGWTIVSCEAVDDGGRTTAFAFPMVVKPLPALAPTGTGVAGGAWRSVGVGFAIGSAVTVEVDGVPVADATSGADGRLSVDHPLPAGLSPGEHLVVLRGIDPAGDPILVVSPVSVVALEPGETPPASPPPGAPTLPPTGPDVPPDPGPPPAIPENERGAAPTTTTTSTTTPAIGNPRTTTTVGPGGPDPDPTPDDDSDASGPSGAAGSANDVAGVDDDSAGGPLGAATLPVTGAAVGGLLVLAVLLIAGGGSLHAGARRVSRRDRPERSDDAS